MWNVEEMDQTEERQILWVSTSVTQKEKLYNVVFTDNHEEKERTLTPLQMLVTFTSRDIDSLTL